MVLPMASRIEWHKVKPATLRGELIELIIALALIAIGWLSLPTLLLAVLAELLVTVALSWYFYPQRGLRRHLADVAKMFGLLCFLAIFILAAYAYAGAGGFANGPWPDPQSLLGVVLLVTVRGGLLVLEAGASSDPRLHWARSALMRGGALIVGSFLAVFTCFLPGVLLAHALALVWPSRAADLAIASVYLITTGVLACILSTMSEHEIAQISGNPYID
jgi:hypothetical protein